MFDVVGQRVLQGHALPGALDGKVQMVRQDKGEVGVQLAVQLVPGLLRNVVGRQHQRFGQVGQQVDVPLADVVERALDAVQIVQLVGHGGEAHPLAEHNQLIAPAVPGQRHISVFRVFCAAQREICRLYPSAIIPERDAGKQDVGYNKNCCAP